MSSLFILGCLFLAACAPDLRERFGNDSDDPAADSDDDDSTNENPVTNEENGDGSTTTQVDATDDWVHLDLDADAAVLPEDSADWDLAFQRYVVMLNGGVSGSAGVETAILPDTDFDAVTQAPADGYVTDEADADDDGKPEYALDSWFLYDDTDHTLSPAPIVYVIHTSAGSYVKLAFLGYYDDAGTSAYPSFRWAAVEGPESE